MKTLSLLLFLILQNTLSFSQSPCQWAYIPDGANAYNSPSLITTDSYGNIIQAGKILGIADMDPGTGPADTSYSFPSYNYFLSKTTNDGHLVWIKYFSRQQINLSSFEFIGVEVNSNDEIVLVGNFFGVVDFDLSVGVDTLRSHFPTYNDYFVAKYNSSGDLMFAFNIGNNTTSNMEVQALTIRPNDEILISANPSGGAPVDVDPGNGVHNSILGNGNIVCYDSNGNYLWNNNINSTYSYGIPNKSIDADGAGNSYLLSVGYYELSVNKFSNNGARLWEKTLGDFSSGARVNPQSVLVDKFTGDFYIAGTFQDTVDFDPGSGIVNKISTSGFYQDGFIAKYDSSMNLLWVNAYAGEMNFGDFSLDFSGYDIVAVGSMNGTIDFGNGLTLSSGVQVTSPLLITLDASGNTLNGYALDGAGYYFTVNSTSNQSSVISGNVTSALDMDPTAATLTLTPGTSHNFIAAYGTFPALTNEQNNTNTFSVFPNPVNDKLIIQSKLLPKSLNFTLTDAIGKTMMKEILSAENNYVEMDKLPAGIYFLTLGEDAKNSFKVIKN
jgi:hypothetical protein